MKTWEEFSTRYHPMGDDPLNFYGCVNAQGEWFDSSDSFQIAVHWCCYEAGQFDLGDSEEELLWMTDEGRKRGYSIIHGSLLKQMYEKGLIK